MSTSWTAAGLVISLSLATGVWAQGPLATEITPNVPAEQNDPQTKSVPERPVATRQTAFAIPFSVDLTPASGIQPVEVRLLVSTDGGKHWSLFLKQRPDARKF